MREHLRRAKMLVQVSLDADRRNTILEFVLAPFELLGTVGAAVLFKFALQAALEGDRTQGTVIALLLAVEIAATGVLKAWHTRVSGDLIERCRERFDREIIELTASVPTIEHYENPAYLAELEFLRNDPNAFGLPVPRLSRAIAFAFQIVLIAVVLILVYPLLLIFPLLAVPSFFAAQASERLRQQAWREFAEPNRRVRHFFDLGTSVSAAKELRVQRLVPEIVLRHREARAEGDRILARADVRAALLSLAAWLFYAVAYGAGTLFIVNRAVHGHISLSNIVLAVLLTGQLNRQIIEALMMFSWLGDTLRIAERFIWLRNYAHERMPVARTAVPARLSRGIEFKGVHFTYGHDGTEVLKGVDLVLPAGSVVAVVGENGAGKTTLVKLLAGMYSPTEGTILVDGVPLTEFDNEDWRRRTSAAFQDFHRFEFSAGQTVGLGDLPHIDADGTVLRALDDAGASDLADQLPQGLRTPLGRSLPDGQDLSGGQWQKLALGRSMMRTEPFLRILDEPTSSLDAVAERQLFERYGQRARAGVGAGTVTLLISHRFSTVRFADLIVVLTDGRVSELGTHAELVAAGGLYAELYELQAASA